MPSLIPDATAFERRLAGLADRKASSQRSYPFRRFKDRQAAFPQKGRCRGHQRWREDRQRIGARLRIRRTGGALGSAPYCGREDPPRNSSFMSPTRRRCLLAIQQSPSTSPESLRDD